MLLWLCHTITLNTQQPSKLVFCFQNHKKSVSWIHKWIHRSISVEHLSIFCKHRYFLDKFLSHYHAFQYLFNFIFASKSTYYLTNFCILYEIFWKQLNVKVLLSFFCGENSCHYINVTSHYHKLSLKLEISFWYGSHSNGLGVTSLRQSC